MASLLWGERRYLEAQRLGNSEIKKRRPTKIASNFLLTSLQWVIFSTGLVFEPVAEGIFEALDSVFEGVVALAASGILVAATVEEHMGVVVDRTVTL